LIVDEVLSVGDLAFQRKCFGRIDDLIRERGKTILIVSHNIRQVERLCSRVILLDNGEVFADGKPADVCNLFYDRSNSQIQKNVSIEQKKIKRFNTSGEIEMKQVHIFEGESDNDTDVIRFHFPMRIAVKFKALVDLKYPDIIVGFHTTDFFYIATMTSATLSKRFEIPTGEHTAEFFIDDLSLTPGVYSIRVGFIDQYHRTIWHGENLRTFMVSGEKINVSKLDSWGAVDFPFAVKLN